MPTLLCMAVYVGASISGVQHAHTATQYAPKDMDAFHMDAFLGSVAVGCISSRPRMIDNID